MSLHLAAALYIYIHYPLKKRKKQRRWWQTQLYTNREVYSGPSVLRELSFQPVSGLYEIFTRMSPTEFEFLINLIGEQISRKDTTFRKAVMGSFFRIRFSLNHQKVMDSLLDYSK
jgi:hypothetical protein